MPTETPGSAGSPSSAREPLEFLKQDPQLEGAVDPTTYVLGPGDGLILSITGRITVNAPLEVDPEGFVWIPDYGRMKLAGRTLDEARAEISRRFRSGVHGIDIQLRLVRLRRFRVYVQGEVGNPGAVEASAVTRVSEAIRRAGGLTEHASRRNIELRFSNDSTRVVDLLRFDRLGDRDANPMLGDGAMAFVPPRHRPVSIYAPIAYPGEYEHRTGDRLSDLLALAGQIDPSAVLDQAMLVRFVGPARTETLSVDLPGVLAGRTDVSLSEGDRIFVPSMSEYHPNRNVSVSGEVVLPGVYPLIVGRDRVSDAIAHAGGITSDGNPRSVLVIRQVPDGHERDPEFERLSRLSRSEMTENEYQIFQTKLATARATHVVDLTPVIEGSAAPREPGIVERDVLLEPGDGIVVERRSHAVRVAGEVRRPGLLDYESGLSGSDYIRVAGGYTGRAGHGSVRLTRAASGQTLLLRDAGAVQPGDFIFVPEKRDVNVWSLLRDTLLVGGSIATIVIAFRR